VNLTFQDEPEGHRRRKPESPEPPSTMPPKPRKRRRAASELGDALRSVYRRTIEEDIPPEMLDLLGKLG
jgi:hypothetical protein